MYLCFRVTVVFPKIYLNLKCTPTAQSNMGDFPSLRPLSIINVNAVVTNNETNKIRISDTLWLRHLERNVLPTYYNNPRKSYWFSTIVSSRSAISNEHRMRSRDSSKTNYLYEKCRAKHIIG